MDAANRGCLRSRFSTVHQSVDCWTAGGLVGRPCAGVIPSVLFVAVAIGPRRGSRWPPRSQFLTDFQNSDSRKPKVITVDARVHAPVHELELNLLEYTNARSIAYLDMGTQVARR